ncbi:hypothetical protein SLNWT_4624 [Streptomyces albus]|uniref:Uncharacterized protein n=1 Tax=Streptomyces albus (strain ATCC 21838 / DSM 41398 / FERM P-419 / JCM 4703 / NBRC 107858) TaxID=1081613 RepID=A0A0B5F070_STRA4|nr:hypothetical protein SLNWT_4624 [Streptomyces albus]AOU79306.1 hypothetical protein SLNHY_4615 [Streptomyces albus]AYN35034.1 hypothetical protein DUI70_4536 [Streptomyces albus]
MSASQRQARPEHEAPVAEPPVPSALSMSELLQSCVAADAVSTPPRTPPHETAQDPREERGEPTGHQDSKAA